MTSSCPWYWTISCSNAVEDPLIVDDAELGVDPDLLDIGHPIENWPSTAVLRVTQRSDDGTPDDALQNFLGLPIFSGRLCKALKAAGIRGFQYLPVQILRPSGAAVEGFCIGNIIERRSALDMTRSDYTVFPDDYFLPARRGLISRVRRAVLVGQRIIDCDAMRLDEFSASVFVSGRFKGVFEDGDFTGYSFEEVEVA